jgi:hypothetical protein
MKKSKKIKAQQVPEVSKMMTTGNMGVLTNEDLASKVVRAIPGDASRKGKRKKAKKPVQ